MRRDPQWHAADWSSFVAGVAFAAVGVIAVVAGGDRFTDAVVWIWSGLLLGLGVALLLRGGDRRDWPRDDLDADDAVELESERPEGPPPAA